MKRVLDSPSPLRSTVGRGEGVESLLIALNWAPTRGASYNKNYFIMRMEMIIMSMGLNDKNDNKTLRRSFLKSSAATLSLATLGASGLSRRVHAAGSGVIKIGLIGSGGRGSGAARDAMMVDEGVQLVAMADVFEDRLQNKRKELKENLPDQVKVDNNHCFVGFDAYKKVIASDVDVVLIACASTFHPYYSKCAIEAGKHVFVEKPHGIDPPGIRMMKEVCDMAKKKKLCLVSGLMNRYVPEVRETINRIKDGAIGDIVAIEENYLRPPYVLVPRTAKDSEIEYHFRNWYHFSWLSGDDVPQSLVHNLDKALWAMNEKTPVKAHGLAGRSASFGDIYGDVFDHHTVVYEYDDGAKIYAFCRTQHNCHGGVSDIIQGTKGRCDLLKNRITGETNWHYTGKTDSGYKVEHKEMLDAIRAGKYIVNDYMVNSTMTGILGQMACYSGKQLTWEQAYNSDFTFGPSEYSFDMESPKLPSTYGNYPIAIPGRTKVI
jgi:myo-inositol 2-dehydrogenase / D-chiro-inositol 1-dehydrogenase